ncbi:uncharacterized protein LOC131628330 [Vicia villosa]|uniref:uncharacterized protein LOC131628330 n=1 Tax=Vicia villosa TaxID=3911 RepID=UPI00273A969F|nr:uncharacterized protein LOC131628330 [Vicia villosa]
MGGWNDGVWKWGDLGISEGEVLEAGLLALYTDLRVLLETFEGMDEGKDSAIWSLDEEKGFTVASCYSRYASLRISFGPPNRCDEALELLWKMEVPFKIKVFDWRLFMNRLPTKDLLMHRGINFTSSNLNCVFCDMHLKEMDHVFFKCNVIKIVWKEIASWVDFMGWKEEGCIPFFMEWHTLSRAKRVKIGKLGVL